MEVVNIGDWLYFLFIIIAGISSLFSSKKKKKRVQQKKTTLDTDMTSEEESELPEKDFWDILQEIKEQSIPKEEPQPQKQSIRKSSQEEKKEPAIQKQPNTQNYRTIPSKEEDNMDIDMELTHASELRKAVIYSEILNRKY